jgi:hypothetical protein
MRRRRGRWVARRLRRSPARLLALGTTSSPPSARSTARRPPAVHRPRARSGASYEHRSGGDRARCGHGWGHLSLRARGGHLVEAQSVRWRRGFDTATQRGRAEAWANLREGCKRRWSRWCRAFRARPEARCVTCRRSVWRRRGRGAVRRRCVVDRIRVCLAGCASLLSGGRHRRCRNRTDR